MIPLVLPSRALLADRVIRYHTLMNHPVRRNKITFLALTPLHHLVMVYSKSSTQARVAVRRQRE